MYQQLEDGKAELKGKQKENIEQNKNLAILSRTLGEINVHAPIEDTLEELKLEEWDNEKVLEIFKELNFKRYIEKIELEEVKRLLENDKKMFFYINTEKDDNENKIIKEKISGISIFRKEEKIAYYWKFKEQSEIQNWKSVFENEQIKKISIDLGKIMILLREQGIEIKNINYDISIAAYILNPTDNKLKLENLTENYLDLDINELLGKESEKNQEQINLFDTIDNNKNDEQDEKKYTLYSYLIEKIQEVTKKKLEEINALELFEQIDMPTVTVLADMQWNGMYADEQELNQFGNKLKDNL